MTIARERANLLPLLAGNLLTVGVLLVVFCAQFQGPEPLWSLQASYFTVGATISVALTPVEWILLNRVRRHTPNVLVEAIVAALSSMLLGVPGGIAVGVVSLIGTRAIIGDDLSGLWVYVLVGGLIIAIACFIVTLIGRLLAELLRRVRWTTHACLAAAALNFVAGLLAALDVI